MIKSRSNIVRKLMRQATAACLIFSTGTAFAQENSGPICSDDAILVFDGSSSMKKPSANTENRPRIAEARRAVRAAVPHITPNRRLGLIVYGPGVVEECSNIVLRFPPLANAGDRLISEVDRIEPFGNTPLSGAVLKAATALDYKNKPGVIALVTDGKETCDGSACLTAETLVEQGMALTVHVIGFQLGDDPLATVDKYGRDTETEKTAARCLADRTGGQYLTTDTMEELADALKKTLGCPLVGKLEDFAPETLPETLPEMRLEPLRG